MKKTIKIKPVVCNCKTMTVRCPLHLNSPRNWLKDKMKDTAVDFDKDMQFKKK